MSFNTSAETYATDPLTLNRNRDGSPDSDKASFQRISIDRNSMYSEMDIEDRSSPLNEQMGHPSLISRYLSSWMPGRAGSYDPLLPTSQQTTTAIVNPYELNLPNSSAFSSFLNMTNSIVGAGIIGLPLSMKESGIGMGLILLASLTWIADWTINLLVHNAKLSGTHNYQDLAHFCFGRAGLIIISVSQFVFAFGGMCAYTVIIGDTIPSVFSWLIPGLEDIPLLYLLGNRHFMVLVLTLIISFPLSLLRDISKLANASFFALVAMLIIVVAVIIEGPAVPEELRGTPQLNWSLWNPEMFQGVAVIAFALVCHHNSFVIFADLEKPTLDRFAMVTHLSTGVSMLFCAIMAIAGYITFTDRTQGNILNNFPADAALINLARFCFGLNMFSTFPLEHYVAREVIENYFYPDKKSTFRSFILTSVLVGVSLTISLLTCDLGFVMEITGGLSASVLAFILPAACFLKLSPLNLFSLRHIPHWLLLAFGVLTMVLSTSLSMAKLFNEDHAQTC